VPKELTRCALKTLKNWFAEFSGEAEAEGRLWRSNSSNGRRRAYVFGADFRTHVYCFGAYFGGTG
jgi:hypothetical protein